METNSLSDFIAALGITPKSFQAFASENRAINARYHTQVIRFEAAIVSVSNDPERHRAQFENTLAEVLSAFTAWRKEQGHG